MRVAMYNSHQAIQQDWFKWALVFVFGVVILCKDISFQFHIRSNTGASSANMTNDGAAPPQPMKTTTVIREGERVNQKRTTIKKRPKDNRANHFSNIGFVMNPSYAKRHNIDPALVAEKRRICFDYVKRFRAIAQTEMKKYGIPASITLAQGLLESDAGGSRLAKQNHNHFGIKCFSKHCRKGHCSNFTDDSHKDFFRKYNNVWESYRAHSLFLQQSRYKHLSRLKSTDYKGWAHGLRKAGYATDKRYANKLIQLIQVMKLNQYDK